MAPNGYRNLSLTTDAHGVFKALVTQLADTLRKPVSYSDAVRIAAEVARANPTLFADAGRRVLDQVTVHELTRRFGLAEHETGAVIAFTGAKPGDVWTEAEAAELLDVWQHTCSVHGVFECRAAECQA